MKVVSKCAACGKCVMGGIRACRDGPVITAEQALANPDFGVAKRDATGKRTPW